ncbi:Ig-like domain-containing protein [Sphingobacterium sp. InxBP1]|uniref:Ig-like domain-containing protein n=1 Tax=Sphingobacterium sp. InxBP1 TaxID=2870328 RepID=UPI0022441980|nr:Ig-like domain-containing protein [Sphingobacterium sp. InxBP1]MCW8311145.1 Ig-like domain-containing protein [Sphingobacterium sp. InxBP1]
MKNILFIEMKSNLVYLSRYLFVLHMLVFATSCDREDIAPADISSIAFEQEEVTLVVGKYEKLQVVHTPADIRNIDYVWSTLDPQVATVENGVVYARRIGETKVTVSVRGQPLKAVAVVRVVPVLPSALQLHISKTTLEVGEEIQATYTIEPNDVSEPIPEIEWHSSDIRICTVDNGKIRAIAPGTVQVTAEVKGMAIKGNLLIQVDPVPIMAIELQPTQAQIQVGEDLLLAAKVLPINADARGLIWKSTDEQVATVVDGKVRGEKPGQAMISVATTDGEKSSTCKVTVTPVQVEHIALSTQRLALVVGDSERIAATVFPVDASDKRILWTSSDNNVAVVSSEGEITAKARGTAIISARSVANPQRYASGNIVVLNPDEQVYTQLSTTGRISDNGYVTANISTLFENGSRDIVRLISWEILSHTGEVVKGEYQSQIVATGMQQRHQGAVKKVYRPYVRCVFELKNQRYERHLEI